MGDWMKVEKATPDKPEIAILARMLGVSIGDAFLEWFRLYAWADDMTGSGTVRFLSCADADKLARVAPRTAEYLASSQIGWVRMDSEGIHFNNFDRHNGKSAKARALDTEHKRKARQKSGECPDSNRTKTGPEERRREENHTSKDVGDVGDVGGSKPASQSSRSSRDLLDEIRSRHTANLADLDWSQAIALAEAASRRVKPLNDRDRRAWMKYGVLAMTAFSEAWLADAADSASRTDGKRQAYFVGALKTKAREQWGIDDAAFQGMFRMIEIPTHVWRSDAIEVRGPE